jgi:hypothetical protein
LYSYTFALVAFLGNWSNDARGDEQCLQRAWQAFNASEWQTAIQHADACIIQFGHQARERQARINRSEQRCPPEGTVSDAEKRNIFNNGLLNDVATSYWIKGKSAATLKHETRGFDYGTMAREAYENACHLACGRTWDPKGWFWSPCEAARREPEMQ